jgi:hypothetical protein
MIKFGLRQCPHCGSIWVCWNWMHFKKEDLKRNNPWKADKIISDEHDHECWYCGWAHVTDHLFQKRKNKMKTFKIPVTYQMWGTYLVQAENLKEAKEKIFYPGFGLPDNASYIDDSIQIDEEGITIHNPVTKISKGDTVVIDDPGEGDGWTHSFIGSVKKVKKNIITVEDQEGNMYSPHKSQITKISRERHGKL